MYEKSLDIREEGTAVWLDEEVLYKDWLNEEKITQLENHLFNSNVLWVTGKFELRLALLWLMNNF